MPSKKKNTPNPKRTTPILHTSKESYADKKIIEWDELKRKGEEEYRKTQLRRNIREDFNNLRNIGSQNSNAIADFLIKYSNEPDLTRQALESYKGSEDFLFEIIWKYITGFENEEMDRLIVEKRLRTERIKWLEDHIPNPIIIYAETSAQGPKFEKIDSNSIKTSLSNYTGQAPDQIQVSWENKPNKPGNYIFNIITEDGFSIEWAINLQIKLDELPENVLNDFAYIEELPLYDEADEKLVYLQQILADVDVSEILVYHPLMGRVLKTAYQHGYWKSPWVQSVFQEWQSRQTEYRRNHELMVLREQVKELNKNIATLSEDEDTEDLSVDKLILIAKKYIQTDPILKDYPVQIHYDEEIDRTILPLKLTISGIPIGELYFQRSIKILPNEIRQEIMNIWKVRSQNYSDIAKNQVIQFADNETRKALYIRNAENSPDYKSRAENLAAICAFLIQRGEVESIQFKRTLSCYYAARGGKLFFDENILEARKYFLLFFRMIYQEMMGDHLKAYRPLEYPVFANLISTYARTESRKIRPPSNTGTEGLDDQLQRKFPMIWRAAQLMTESTSKFFEAMLDLYQIDGDFVRQLLVDLRNFASTRSKNANSLRRFKLNNLDADSLELMEEVVDFSISIAPQSVSVTTILEFCLSILDIKDISSQVFNDLERVLAATRKFIFAKDLVPKSTLYTDVDREFLQTRSTIDGLANKFRSTQEQRRKMGRLRRYLERVKGYADRNHREFFRSAKLDVTIDNTISLPRNELSPLELNIRNDEFGLASNVEIILEKDPSFIAKEYYIKVDPLFAKEDRIEAIYISPLALRAVELRGRVDYSDQDNSHKTVTFRQIIKVYDTEDFISFRSPYITGNPVRDSEMFFGRKEELVQIIRLISGHFQDRVIAIHGRRKIGKTSLLFQLKQGDPIALGIAALQETQANYLPVLLDFERFSKETKNWEIYHKIYQEIKWAIQSQGFDFAENQLSLLDFQNLPPEPLLQEYLVSIIQFLKQKRLKLLLMMDEFDNLIHIRGEERGIFGFIREIIIKYGDTLSFIFVGADQLFGMMKDKASRLFSMANFMEIKDLTTDEARLLVIEPMKRVNPRFEWAEGAVRRVVVSTSGNPYFIQMICDTVVNNLIEGKRLRATAIDVENASYSVVNQLGPLADIIQSIDKIEIKVVLTCIAELTQHEILESIWITAGMVEAKIIDIATKFPIRNIPSILRWLHSRYILEQRGGEGTEMEYCFRVPLLRIYLLNSMKLVDALREGNYL